MGFHIATITSQDVVLLRDRSTTRFRNVFMLAASVFFIIGITGLYFTWHSKGYVFIFFGVFTGIAAFLLGIGPVVVRRRQAFDPLQLTFSNSKGTLTVIQDRAAIATACIPYSNIAFFGIREERESNSNDRVTTASSYKYIVYFRKKDGSTWELLETRSQREAITMLEALQQNVKLSQPGTCPPVKTLSDKLETAPAGSAAGISWRNDALAQLLLFIPIILLIGGVLTFFWYAITGPFAGGQREWFPAVILGFISVIFLTVIAGNTYKIIKDSRTVYDLAIGRSDFRYTESTRGGRIRKEVIYKLSDIKGVIYNYRLSKTESDIHILRQAEMEQHNRMLNGDISFADIVPMLRASLNELQLHITALNCTERLQLENWIQETIARHAAAENR